MIKRVVLLAGPCVALLVGFFMWQWGWEANASWTAGIATLTALWWIFEPVPVPATSLIPVAVFPLVGVLKAEQVAAAYGDQLILLLLGGCLLSSAMERSGAHRRIALMMVQMMGGTSGKRLVLGFMAASALLSMWISNTATALMLLPIALAVVEKVENEKLVVALLLGIAYAASIGGVGTPVGTPPNLAFMKYYDQEVSFLQWMVWTLPVVLIMVPIAGFWLTRNLELKQGVELPKVGAWRTEEVLTLVVFSMTALLWITRRDPYGGWSTWLNLPEANDASVALLAVLVMFAIPNGRGSRLLDWETAVTIPWGVLLLFSGGIVLAVAFGESGLSSAIGDSLNGWSDWPTVLVIGVICLTITFLTEVTSNTATANLMLPILAATATSIEVDSKLLMIPATISASFAFMLPVATAPNAVVFSSQRVAVSSMAREGVLLNVIGAVVVTLVCYVTFG